MNISRPTARDNIRTVIYSRTATTEAGHAAENLKNQEIACRGYATQRGYDIVEMFTDEGFSGMSTTRPSLQAMLSFLRENPGHVVLVGDLFRLSRSPEVLLELQNAIARAGGTLDALGFDFGRTALATPEMSTKS